MVNHCFNSTPFVTGNPIFDKLDSAAKFLLALATTAAHLSRGELDPQPAEVLSAEMFAFWSQVRPSEAEIGDLDGLTERVERWLDEMQARPN
jgi:hypothetical protein